MYILIVWIKTRVLRSFLIALRGSNGIWKTEFNQFKSLPKWIKLVTKQIQNLPTAGIPQGSIPGLLLFLVRFEWYKDVGGSS
jgi:hypothetical protein